MLYGIRVDEYSTYNTDTIIHCIIITFVAERNDYMYLCFYFEIIHFISDLRILFSIESFLITINALHLVKNKIKIH